MKKIMCVLVLTLGWLVSSRAQAQDVVYGTARADGYEKVTKGAFWSSRPEAKMVFEGSEPPGCTVYTLDKEYFVRFVEAEHNSEDKNYIVFPVGSRVYVKGGKYYSAKCGNEIEFIKPVNSVKIIKKPVEKTVEVSTKKESEPEPEKPKPVVNDTVYKKTVVWEEEYIRNVQVVNSYPDYYGMSLIGWLFMPRCQRWYPCYDRNVYNTYVNNYGFYGNQGNHRPNTIPTPVDNHLHMGGGRGNDNYTTGEGGGRSDNSNTSMGGGRSASVARDGMGRITSSQVSSSNPTAGMVRSSSSSSGVSRNSSYSSGVNTRVANRIYGDTNYDGGSRRISSGVNMVNTKSSFNPSSVRTSSRMSNSGNGLIRSSTSGMRR